MKTPPISEYLTLRSLLALVIIISIGSISYSFGRAEGRYNAQTNLMLENQHAHDGEKAHGVTGAAAGLDALPRTVETLRRSKARAAFSAERQKLREQRGGGRMHAHPGRMGTTAEAGEAGDGLRASSREKGQSHLLDKATSKPQATSTDLKSAASQVTEPESKATLRKSVRAKERPGKLASKAGKAAYSSSNSSTTKPRQQQALRGGAKQKPQVAA